MNERSPLRGGEPALLHVRALGAMLWDCARRRAPPAIRGKIA